MIGMASQSNPPRPKARVRVSQDRDLVDGDALESSSTNTILSPNPLGSPSKRFQQSSFRRSSSNTTEALEYFEAADDDDDFFNNTNRKRGNSRMNASKNSKGMGQNPIVEEDEEEEDELSSDTNDSPQTKKRKGQAMHKRAYQPAWGRTTSLGKKKTKSGLDSDISDEENESSESENILTDGLNKEKQQTAKQQTKKKARQLSSSPELEQPPDATPERYLKLYQVLEGHKAPNYFNDDDTTIQEVEVEKHDLHPDLLKLRQGKGATRFRSIDRIGLSQTSIPVTKSEVRTGTTSGLPSISGAPIEISDSDDESPGSQARNGPITRAAANHNRDSSPIEILEEVRSSTASGPSQPSTSSASVRKQNPKPEAEPTPPKTEPVVDDYMDVVMKAEGGIEVPVKVRPTTLVKKLLDHFCDLHRDKIPSNRISKVRIRFDGEVLKDKQSMTDIDIDEGDQMDVIW